MKKAQKVKSDKKNQEKTEHFKKQPTYCIECGKQIKPNRSSLCEECLRDFILI